MDGYDAYAEERDIQQWAEDNARRRTAVKAWGCNAEAQGKPRCGGWCESETCPVDDGVASVAPAGVVLSASDRSDLTVAAAAIDGPDSGPGGWRLAKVLRRIAAAGVTGTVEGQ